MKIVFMEADTLGKDVDLSEFDKLGEVVKYPASKPAENAKRIEDADIIIVNKIPVNEELLKEAKNVKLVCVTATGTNIVDMPYVESRGIVVTNVKGIRPCRWRSTPLHCCFMCMKNWRIMTDLSKAERMQKVTCFPTLRNHFMSWMEKFTASSEWARLEKKWQRSRRHLAAKSFTIPLQESTTIRNINV